MRFLFLLIFIVSCNVDNNLSQLDKRANEILSSLSLEDKVGQMTQINLTVIAKGPNKWSSSFPMEIDSKKAKKALVDFKVGSVLNTINNTAQKPETWFNTISDIQDFAMNDTESKIPVIYGIDAIHGVTYTKGSTLFPHNIGLAATRNPIIANQIAAATAKETRASGLRWNFDPVLDVGRNPLWPRFCETFGEDPFLVSTLGTELIKGYEQDGLSEKTAVASCMKHFIGYSDPKSGKDRTEAYISDITLWQKHIPSFKAAIDAGASTVMINSSMINDVPVHGSYKLLTELLRNKLGFKGMIVTDWEDIIRLHSRHKIAATPREAVKIAIDAGIDMSMVPNSFSFCEHLIDLVKSGEVSEDRIDASVKRILVLKKDLGLFDEPYPEKDAVQNFGLQEYQSLALNSARESMVLLKNEGDVLPLPKNKRYLLLGPGANCLSALNGCWSYSWQGDKEDVYPNTSKTILDVFQERFGDEQVMCDVKRDYSDATNFNINFSDEEISNVDYVILFLGENAYAESPGNIDDLTLDQNQIDLAKRAIALDKKIILVLIQGRPRIINDFSENIDGIVNAFLPGSMGAQAIVDVLFGDFNPSGTLPFTYPAHSGDLLTYDHKNLSAMVRTAPNKKTYGGYHPAFKFGDGLSYSDFVISNFKLSADTINVDEKIQISFQLKNNSERDGTKNIDVFIKDHYASLAPDVRNLKYFTKVSLKAGAQKEVRIDLDKNDLFFFNSKGEKLLEEGSFSVFVEEQNATFYLNK